MSKKSKVKNLISGFVTDSPNNCNLGEIHSVYKNALKESDAAAQRYLNIAGTILVAIDKDGKITLLNKKGYKLLGYKEGSLLGKNWFKIALPKSEQKKVRVMFSKIMAGK